MKINDLKIYKREFKSFRETNLINKRIARRYYLKGFYLAQNLKFPQAGFYFLKSFILEKKFIALLFKTIYNRFFKSSKQN